MAEQKKGINKKAKQDEFLGQPPEVNIHFLEVLAGLQEKRSVRFAKTKDRIVSQLGEDHPMVAKMSLKALSSENLKNSLRNAAFFETKRKVVKPKDWLIFGRVSDTEGRPLSNLHVSLFDKENRLSREVLGKAETDDSGIFTLSYKESIFTGTGEEIPELYVRVKNKKGKELFSSKRHIKYKPGQVEHVEIILPKK